MITEVFELVDSSDDERYYPLGIFLTQEDAEAALGNEPWDLAEYPDEYVELELRKRVIGLSDSGSVVWTRKWQEEYNEDGDEMEWIEK